MFARHDLVWLSAHGWDRVCAGAEPEHRTALDGWRRAGWPAVVRRDEAVPVAGQETGLLALGIALPPRVQDDRKLRIAARAPIADVGRHAPPLPLLAALDAAPARWRGPLAAFEREATAHGLSPAAYGSVALQAVTGQSYLRETSDIDVLLRPLGRAHLETALALLARHAAALPLDGEIVFPDGRAVAWKELQAALDGAPGTRVLAKELARISLVPLDELFATMEELA
ncbi:malonate decarboxylase holo-[acyl-carrier-protein] synthase [Massilia sp. KIM]|uniref:malonate decarboxylase holo-[acyl-carrier-protein] synthase n=1 Tax=Massilia sp. KIM TaxID=1955422 RepID=UPI00098EF128|nr:malonate decarboxylase holo-[acyl-carrier-protein] synthase [Massilia sp. KIM]OON63552.1 malonate decarboxylase holo-[acyl-carrier-protein] synthase [Massilia sp. KIM]